MWRTGGNSILRIARPRFLLTKTSRSYAIGATTMQVAKGMVPIHKFVEAPTFRKVLHVNMPSYFGWIWYQFTIKIYIVSTVCEHSIDKTPSVGNRIALWKPMLQIVQVCVHGVRNFIFHVLFPHPFFMAGGPAFKPITDTMLLPRFCKRAKGFPYRRPSSTPSGNPGSLRHACKMIHIEYGARSVSHAA